MNRARPKQIIIRASEEEFNYIKSKVEMSKLKQNKYLLRCALDKEVVVIDGLNDFTLELKRIEIILINLQKQPMKEKLIAARY